MTSSGRRLLERMRNSKAGWNRNDLDRLYKAFGFVITHGGSHDIVKHQIHKDLRSTLPRHKTIAVAYVVEAIKRIDELLERQEPNHES